MSGIPAIQIHERIASSIGVQVLPSILFQMHSDEADFFLRAVDIERHQSFSRQGDVVLADLKTLREVGIEIMFSIPFRESGDLTIQREPRLDGEFKSSSVHYRQDARHADRNRAHQGVGRFAELRSIGAEKLAFREKLHMDFQADDNLVRFCCHDPFPFRISVGRCFVSQGFRHQSYRLSGLCYSSADRLCQSVAC